LIICKMNRYNSSGLLHAICDKHYVIVSKPAITEI
jgi:hypothetical protein